MDTDSSSSHTLSTMPWYALRTIGLDPTDLTRTFLWDVLVDEASLIDRAEHDRRSLSLAFIVARDLFGFDEDQQTFQSYLNDVPRDASEETAINDQQTMHDRCMLAYYYCWLIPMLDEEMRRGVQARYEADVMYLDEKLDYAIQLVTPVIVNFWRHKTLASIEKKCMQRIKSIVEGIPNKVPSDIDWNTMSQLGRDRLMMFTDRIRRRLEKQAEWAQTMAHHDAAPEPIRHRKRKTDESRDGASELEPASEDVSMKGEPAAAVDAPVDAAQVSAPAINNEPSAQPEHQVITLSARMGGGGETSDQQEDKLRQVKFSM